MKQNLWDVLLGEKKKQDAVVLLSFVLKEMVMRGRERHSACIFTEYL